MSLVFAPSANAILSAVRPEEAGQASGATNAIRELGGVMGVAVLATIFSAHGSYASPQAFSDGVVAALPIGAAVLARRRGDRAVRAGDAARGRGGAAPPRRPRRRSRSAGPAAAAEAVS